jgi:hypothetical protein
VSEPLRIGTRGRRLGIALAAVLSFAGLLVGSSAKPASAATFDLIFNYQTNMCLASNSLFVYTEKCNFGPSEEWEVDITPSSWPNAAIQSVASGLWLDSNAAGQLYANTGNGGQYQSWVQLYPNDDGEWAFQDVATGLWLDSNYAGDAYTHVGNGGTYQSWIVETTSDL